MIFYFKALFFYIGLTICRLTDTLAPSTGTDMAYNAGAADLHMGKGCRIKAT